MSNNNIEEKLLAFICKNFMVEPDEFDMDESLVDQGVIDSIGLVEIAGFMEDEFDIEVDETDMIREHFGSFKKMVTFVAARVTG